MNRNQIIILIVIALMIYLNLKSVKEHFFMPYPISTRNTRNMIYDIRGHPLYPNFRRGYFGSFMYRLFPYWYMSPRHPYLY